jgi:hypothetical protein
MNRGEEIVPAAHVAQLMRENRAKLSRIQVFQELAGRTRTGRRKPTMPGSSAPAVMTARTGIGSSMGVPARSTARTPNQLRHRASVIAKNPSAQTRPIAAGAQSSGARAGTVALRAGENGSAI